MKDKKPKTARTAYLTFRADDIMVEALQDPGCSNIAVRMA
jgi:catabolite regulation protein CreA